MRVLYKGKLFVIFCYIYNFLSSIYMIKRFFSMALATLVVWFGGVSITFAQIDVKPVPGEGADLIGWIVTILRYLIGLTGIIAAAVLIFNGILYITASGDEGKITKATKGITYAIIGLIVAAISFLIVNFVAQTLQETKGGSASFYNGVYTEATLRP
jgi:hypothetical protein